MRNPVKFIYQSVGFIRRLRIYATSNDYDWTDQTKMQFFEKVQNKLHYAVHGHTAAEYYIPIRRYVNKN